MSEKKPLFAIDDSMESYVKTGDIGYRPATDEEILENPVVQEYGVAIHTGTIGGKARRTMTWRALSKKIRKRDGNRCRCCDGNYRLCAHHKTPKANGGTDDPENLITLCGRCHPTLELKVYYRLWKTGETHAEAFLELFKEKRGDR